MGHCSCGRCHCQQNVRGVSFHSSINITIPCIKLKSRFNDFKVPEYRYYGDACECNNFDCGLDSDSKICSGEFGSYCMCVHAQLMLTYLALLHVNLNCILCAGIQGHGTCECGQCVCDKAPSGRQYTGEICDCYPDDDVCRKSPKEVRELSCVWYT